MTLPSSPQSPFSSPTPAVATKGRGAFLKVPCQRDRTVLRGNMVKTFSFIHTFLNLQRELEQENAGLKESKNECEHSLQHHQLELKKLKVFI